MGGEDGVVGRAWGGLGGMLRVSVSWRSFEGYHAMPFVADEV